MALFITEGEVDRLLSFREAIEASRRGSACSPRGRP